MMAANEVLCLSNTFLSYTSQVFGTKRIFSNVSVTKMCQISGEIKLVTKKIMGGLSLFNTVFN